MNAAVVVAILLASIAAPALADPSGVFLSPQVKPGDRLAAVFSKAVAISGDGFDTHVGRISGDSSDEVASVAPDVITLHETYLYDGRPGGLVTTEVRDHGATICTGGKCAPNDQTSASMFNPLLWGPVPTEISAGDQWKVVVAAPWEIGPAGEEEVRVVRLDAAQGLVTLERRGSGQGPSSDDAAQPELTITSKGRSLKVRIVPGETHWEGRATIIKGVTLSDEIMARRPVTLIADNGETFKGEERVYTLYIQAPAA
jgi:hypothetical protein